MNILHSDPLEGISLERTLRIRDAVLASAAPAALAILELFHPHPGHHLLAMDVHTWLTVHYMQVPLFALSAFSVATLVDTQTGFPAQLCRMALLVFALCFVVFDTAAGLVVGNLVEAAHASGRPGAWQAPIDAVWTHPILGGTNHPLLALVGRMALSIGTASAAASLYCAGRPWRPALLLALSGCVMYVFPEHSWPGGPLTFGSMAAAVAWLRWGMPGTREAGLDNRVASRDERQAAKSYDDRQRP